MNTQLIITVAAVISETIAAAAVVVVVLTRSVNENQGSKFHQFTCQNLEITSSKM